MPSWPARGAPTSTPTASRPACWTGCWSGLGPGRVLAEAADGEAGDVLEELWGAAAAAAFNQRRAVMGYRVFGLAERLDLIRWLYVRAWQAGERPSVLFDLAANRLVEAKVLLPGVTVLERLVAAVRDRTAARAFRLLATAPSPLERARLLGLVDVAPGQRVSDLDRMRKSPVDISGAGVVKALDRYTQIAALGAGGWDLSAVPPGRVAALARFAKAARAQAVDELAPDRRLATLVAFAADMEPTAADEALEVFDLLVGDMVRLSGYQAGKERLRTLKELDG